MCVWKPGSRSNGCQGDSGGPVAELIRERVYDKGSWNLAGVVSFGVTSACASNTPLVLTRVSEPSILNWIKETVGKDLPFRSYRAYKNYGQLQYHELFSDICSSYMIKM